MKRRKTMCAMWVAGAALASVPVATLGQTTAATRLVTSAVHNEQRLILAGTAAPETIAAADTGVLPANKLLPHMLLQLRRPDASDQGLEGRILAMHTPGDPLFHRWMSAAEVGSSFGPHPDDVAAVTSWLAQQGFAVNHISGNRLLIDFSGTAGQVSSAFSTELHAFVVNGARHVGNVQELQIPAALAPLVVGVSTLNDFGTPMPKRIKAKAAGAAATPDAETGNPRYHGLAPGDIHTIYNFKPALQAGHTGRGQTVAVLEPVDLPSADDWNMFRTTFGLAGYKHGKLTMSHPGGCTDPGLRPDDPGYELYAAAHAEWASAGAPNATIEVASCAEDETRNGVVQAMLGIIDEATPPDAVSIGYIRCEAGIGQAIEATLRYSMQQAAAEGISVYASAGDVGGSTCDFATNSFVTETGLAASAYASSPHVVAVGGTEFTDIFDGTTANYWRTTDRADYSSAKSYIPEAPFNFSCGSTLIANRFGYAVPYGANGFCNSTTGEGYVDNIASGGGPSSCAYGQPAPGGTSASGTCKGFAKPNFQQGVPGVPADGVRDLPDVSMAAAGPGTFFLLCFSDPTNPYSAPCTGDPTYWNSLNGTTVTAPLLAGVQALVDQAEGAPQGNPNYVFYSLARQQIATQGTFSCDASLGPEADPSCVFHDITRGDNEVACLAGTPDCYAPSGAYGVLSRSSTKYVKAYQAALGWDFASGLGSFDVSNLIAHWNDLQPLP